MRGLILVYFPSPIINEIKANKLQLSVGWHAWVHTLIARHASTYAYKNRHSEHAANVKVLRCKTHSMEESSVAMSCFSPIRVMARAICVPVTVDPGH